MYLISIEGLDKSGKHTFSTSLKEVIQENGLSCALFSFPNYDSPTGSLIKSYLNGEWECDPVTFDLIQAADKIEMKKTFYELEQQGIDFLILDRYSTSQEVYATAAGVPNDLIHSLLQFNLTPNIEFYLNISVGESMKRAGKFGENDKYEGDERFLERVYNLYEKVYSKRVENDPCKVYTINAELSQNLILRNSVDYLNRSLGMKLTIKETDESRLMETIRAIPIWSDQSSTITTTQFIPINYTQPTFAWGTDREGGE